MQLCLPTINLRVSKHTLPLPCLLCLPGHPASLTLLPLLSPPPSLSQLTSCRGVRPRYMPCCDCSRQNGSKVGRHRRGVLQELVVRRVLLLAVCDVPTATSHARCHGIWCDCGGCTRVRGHAPLTLRSSVRINEHLTFRSNRILNSSIGLSLPPLSTSCPPADTL